jgi:uncharacterized protein (DUF2141 family)
MWGSSLTRGRVRRLQLLLALANVVILGSKSHGILDHILLSQIRDSRNLDGQVHVFLYAIGTGWPTYTLRHWVPFSSASKTRRATVELFELASTRASSAVLSIYSLVTNRIEDTSRTVLL